MKNDEIDNMLLGREFVVIWFEGYAGTNLQVWGLGAKLFLWAPHSKPRAVVD